MAFSGCEYRFLVVHPNFFVFMPAGTPHQVLQSLGGRFPFGQHQVKLGGDRHFHVIFAAEGVSSFVCAAAFYRHTDPADGFLGGKPFPNQDAGPAVAGVHTCTGDD